jgi:hypothetical protein
MSTLVPGVFYSIFPIGTMKTKLIWVHEYGIITPVQTVQKKRTDYEPFLSGNRLENKEK